MKINIMNTFSNRLRRVLRSLLLLLLLLLPLFVIPSGSTASAASSPALSSAGVHKAGDSITYNGRKIATYDKKGRMVLIPSKIERYNHLNLNYLMQGNKKKTIVIPSGKTIRLSGVLYPGNNTTIYAKGAKIIAKPESNVIFATPVMKLKNLSIIGGTWRSPDKGGRTGSLFQFSYVNGLLLNGIDCNANIEGHAIELIACKN